MEDVDMQCIEIGILLIYFPGMILCARFNFGFTPLYKMNYNLIIMLW